ncbi:Rasal1 [Symbiodinium natans]|uniref:Rasal1 protein n=1 Tax=Symbiodinium natans TaxID=878477 RepID=A0A812UAC0_9DINO|nr:Rasal1 [Symbiodinium natans]
MPHFPAVQVEAYLKLHIISQKRDMQGLAPFHNQRKVAKGGMQYKLEVCMVSADGLRSADWMSQSSDPYCICKVKGKGTTSIRTKVVSKDLNPVWQHKEVIEDFYHGDALLFTVKDSDKIKHDDTLGSVQLQRPSW